MNISKSTLQLFLIYSIKKDYFRLLAIATIMSILVPGLVAVIFTRDMWKPTSERLANKKEIIKYGLPLILSMGITTVFQAIDKISLNKYCTYSEVGIYSSAMSLINIFAIIQSTFN